MIITIDGPSASGKSTISKIVADQLGFYYINTGLMYRAIAYIGYTYFGLNTSQLAHLSKDVVDKITDNNNLVYHYNQKDGATMLYEGNNITPFLKDAFVDTLVSIISPQAIVRTAMVTMQQHIAYQHDSIAEGRDLGTVVFPHAHYKFFVTASLEERARRWQKDQHARGHTYTLEQAKTYLQERDTKDSNRTLSPLKKPAHAKEIDTTHKTIAQSAQEIISTVKQ